MKKALSILALAALLLPGALKAQITTFPWNEDFESGTPANFTFVDADNDGHNWRVPTGNYNCHSGSGIVASASWDETAGALTPDNWMILPSFTIPATASDLELTWYAVGQDASFAAEQYKVYISTTGGSVADFTPATEVYSATTTGTYAKGVVSLASYAGQTIYVAFRHNGSTDMFELVIDDIRVGGPEAPTVSVSGPDRVRLGNAATFTATASASPISWLVDGVATTVANDTLTTTFTTAGTHTVVVSATNAVGTTYDTATIDVFDCPTATLPYAPVFGTNDLGCWDTLVRATAGAGWFPAHSYNLGMMYSMSAYDYYGYGYLTDLNVDNWAVSPYITMGTGTYEVAWMVRAYNANYASDHYSVYVISGTDSTVIFSETLTSNEATYVARTASIPSTVTGDFKIAFRHHGSTGGYILLIDSIKVQALSAPNVTISGPTTVPTNTPATFTATSSTATSYAWTVDGTAISGATTATLTHTFTTTGSHTVQVEATNSVGTGAPASMTVEAITCETITSLPYNEDFEGSSAYCWSFVSNNGYTADDWRIEENNDGTRVLYSSWNEEAAADDYAISPAIAIPASADGLVLSFDIRGRGYQGLNTSYEVLASTTGTAIADFTTVLLSESDLNMTSLESRTVALDQLAGQTVRIAFHNNSPADSYDIVIDNVTIRSALNPVYTISGPASTQTDIATAFTATRVEGEEASMIVTWSSTMVAANQATITGANTLTPTITYTASGIDTVVFTASNSHGTYTDSLTVTVISCDPITTFPWNESFEDASANCWIMVNNNGVADDDFFVYERNDYANTGSHLLYSAYNQTAALDEYAISPAITLPADGELQLFWWVRGGAWEDVKGHYEVLLSNGGTAIADFTTVLKDVEIDTFSVAYRSYERDQVSLAAYAGQTIRIAFHNITAADGNSLMFDDITIGDNTGISNIINATSLSVYPNPASSMVEVAAENVEGSATVSIVDLNGRTVMQQQGVAASYRFDVSSLAAGTYFVRLTGENTSAVQKLIVK